MKQIRNTTTAALLLALGLPLSSAAQQPSQVDPSRLHATREQLQAQLGKFEQGARVEGYSDMVRQIARDEADLIRQRLEEGDIQVGDQIELTVQGMATLTSKFTVTDGRVLILPDIGVVPLAGLLRSELQSGIRDHLSRFIVDPQVFVRSSIRLSVWGEVGSPGYILVPSDYLLTEVLATAGQPNTTARQDEMEIKRGNDVIWDGEALQEAIIQGRTIDQLNLRAGDKIEVPAAPTGGSKIGGMLRSLYYLIPLGFAIARIL